MQPLQPVEDVSGDLLLESLVATAATDPDFTIGLTLSVNGAIVSGDLVSLDAWLGDVSSLLARTGEVGARFGEAFESQVQQAQLHLASEDPQVYGYLHLRNAAVLHGEVQLPTVPDGLWRIRIAHVSGWQMGTLTRS